MIQETFDFQKENRKNMYQVLNHLCIHKDNFHIIEDYLHREVDDYVSCLHFKLNKEIIEIDCNKDIFEVISD
jgi:hypothetical protein